MEELNSLYKKIFDEISKNHKVLILDKEVYKLQIENSSNKVFFLVDYDNEYYYYLLSLEDNWFEEKLKILYTLQNEIKHFVWTYEIVEFNFRELKCYMMPFYHVIDDSINLTFANKEIQRDVISLNEDNK